MILYHQKDADTCRTIRWISADKPRDPKRKLEYALSVPPLNRTILDGVFTVIFLLEDLPTRCEWYHKSGWGESKLALDRYTHEYGNLPEWRLWLDELSNHINRGKTLFRITNTEASALTVSRLGRILVKCLNTQ